MTQDYGTIKVPRPTYQDHNERRQEFGLTWEEYLNQETVRLDAGPSVDEIRSIVRDELRSALREAQRGGV